MQRSPWTRSGASGSIPSVNTKAATKTLIRRLTRTLGYDVVPLGAGMTKLQIELLGRTPLAIDAGANVGQYAERLRDIGYGGRIISFEPGAAAFGTLSAKAARGHRWEARHLALGSAAGMATLRVSANSVSSSLLDVAEEHLRAAPTSGTIALEDVPVSTLDVELRDEVQSPFWLKLDVQGHELAVLAGATQTLARTLAIQTEVSLTHLYDGQSDWLDLCRHIQDAGFTARYIEPGYEDRHSGHMLQADLLFVRRGSEWS
jgi:FkbM family methyltransferase